MTLSWRALRRSYWSRRRSRSLGRAQRCPRSRKLTRRRGGDERQAERRVHRHFVHRGRAATQRTRGHRRDPCDRQSLHHRVEARQAARSIRGVGARRRRISRCRLGAADDAWGRRLRDQRRAAQRALGHGQRGRKARHRGLSAARPASTARYEIIERASPAGDSYEGQLALTPSGNIYRLIRRAGSTTYYGAAHQERQPACSRASAPAAEQSWFTPIKEATS